MNLFAEPDRSQLVGPPDLFDGAALEEEHGAWGHQLLRAATALEMLTQITGRDLRVLLKGGTLLQNSLAWPPFRASVDLDLEVEDARELEAELEQVEDSFARSSVRVTFNRDTPLAGFTGYVQFPRRRDRTGPSGSTCWRTISGRPVRPRGGRSPHRGRPVTCRWPHRSRPGPPRSSC